MRSVNKVTLLGYVGQDPKIVNATVGVLATFSVATSYRKAGKDGKKGDEVTEWHHLVAFGRTAEIVRDYVSKGTAIYVEGNLQTRTWEKNGEKRYATEIVVRELSLLGSMPGGARDGSSDDPEITDDDIPF